VNPIALNADADRALGDLDVHSGKAAMVYIRVGLCISTEMHGIACPKRCDLVGDPPEFIAQAGDIELTVTLTDNHAAPSLQPRRSAPQTGSLA